MRNPVHMAGVLLLCVTAADAGKPQLTVAGNFREATIAVVAKIEQNSRVPVARMAGSKPKAPVQDYPSYPCEFRLKPAFLIKGTAADIANPLVVLMYWHRSDCTLDHVWGQEGPVKAAVWFLRRENGVYRPVVDNGTGLFAINDPPRQVVEATGSFQQPAERLMFLLLSPDIVFSPRSFAEDSGRLTHQMQALGHWEGYLRVVRALYLKGSQEYRQQICLILSQDGMCVECARKAERTLPPPLSGLEEARKWTYRYLSHENLLDFQETELKPYDVASLDELHKRFVIVPDWLLKDTLIWHACTSAPRLRSKARSLLEKFFGVNPKDLPCVPCEQ